MGRKKRKRTYKTKRLKVKKQFGSCLYVGMEITVFEINMDLSQPIQELVHEERDWLDKA